MRVSGIKCKELLLYFAWLNAVLYPFVLLHSNYIFYTRYVLLHALNVFLEKLLNNICVLNRLVKKFKEEMNRAFSRIWCVEVCGIELLEFCLI